MTMPAVLLIALLAALALAACGPDEHDAAPAPTAGPPTTPTAQSTTTNAADESSDTAAAEAGTPIRMTFGDTSLTARLRDTATARDLVAQLPLTLTFRDFNEVEKIAPLPRELSLEGAPDGADPEIGELGYYAPQGVLVLYYGDVGPFDGIVRIGRFDGDVDAIEGRREDFEATIERADAQ